MSVDLETAVMMGDSARRYADERYHFLARHAVLADAAGYSRAAWHDYASFGWLALRQPEAAGGLAADIAAVCALMEVAGSHLLMEPLLASALIATDLVVLAGNAAQQDRLLPALAEGTSILAFAHADVAQGAALPTLHAGRLQGRVDAVLHGDAADLFIVAAREHATAHPVLMLVPADAPGMQVARYRFIDGRGAANLLFDGAPAESLDGAPHAEIQAIIDKVLATAVVAQCAEVNAITRRLMEATTAYLKIRHQFGKPIGTNQALQHRAVDLLFLQQEIAAMARHAQDALALPAPARDKAVSAAKAYIAQAARRIGNEAVQMHGGVGVTDELDISHYFRRLMVNAALFGTRDAHFARFIAASAGHGG
jgi:alkylation response protein AidB-like acyl-CoA dehydrogenase